MEENTTHDKVGIARIVLGLRLATQVHHGSLDGARAWIIIGVNGWNGRGEAHCRAKVKSLPCDEPSKHWVVGKRCAAEGSLHPGDSQLDRQRLRTQKACVVPMRAGILRVAVLWQEERTLAYIHKQMFHSVGFRGSVPSIGGHQIDGVRRVCFSSPLKRGDDRSGMRGCV